MHSHRATAAQAERVRDGEPTALHDGPVPKHAQLREILRELAGHEILPGAAMPSERDIAVRFGVSRLTVREAVGQLVADGLLVRVRGKGTFTTRQRVDAQLHLASFTEDIRRRRMVPETVLLDRAEATPPPTTAEALNLAPEQAAYWLFRQRKADGVPMAVERSWYHPDHVPGLLDQNLTGSLYTLLTRTYGVVLEHGTQTVLADDADTETARLLEVRPGSAVLVFRRISTARGQPVEDATSWYRGDLYQVTMQLQPNPTEPGHNRPSRR